MWQMTNWHLDRSRKRQSSKCEGVKNWHSSCEFKRKVQKVMMMRRISALVKWNGQGHNASRGVYPPEAIWQKLPCENLTTLFLPIIRNNTLLRNPPLRLKYLPSYFQSGVYLQGDRRPWVQRNWKTDVGWLFVVVIASGNGVMVVHDVTW